MAQIAYAADVTLEQVRRWVGECRLALDSAIDPDASPQTTVFADEDLTVAPFACECSQRCLRVRRRVPRHVETYFVPVTVREAELLAERLGPAPGRAAGSWLDAEEAVTALTRTRPYVQRHEGTPLIWCPPGVPLAFTVAPW